MEKMDINLKNKESKILIASIPVAVIIGTSIAILAYRMLGENSALYAIIGGVIIASVLTYFLSRSKRS
jgi:hypothetical protein